MHGRQSEERQRKRHMWPVPALATVGDSSSVKFLSKDGRKISTGDCALFQAGNAPPFIGIIRCLTEDKEGQVKLGVNWLYRPADVKLVKGVLLEAAPNEVFYSFHKDEISAASLLHPCKVAFLRKGVELPSGVSSFVCRRVYDTTNKCLWWLTDQDYTDERQSEVDQLLDKTRHEMHAVIQSGGPSPKENGMSSTLKTGSDNVQNGSFPSQVKGKKRERSEHNTDPVKRERLSRSDASEPGHIKLECSTRPEGIAKITNKDGSLINSECVGQLVHLMQLDRNDATKKGIDLALWRKELVGVVATTDRDDCLSQFVQLRGLPILDDWLQEAHKGKTGDIGSPKESDKVVEELLITLLHALGKLPVDLDALKTCNVGKSVNHLRNHKNTDIQKRARNLVDTWKKRVDAEMKSNDTKSGSSQGVSLPCKQVSGEVSHAHAGRRGGHAETVKSSMPLNSTAKTVSSRSVQTDILSRTASAPSASVKVSALHSSTISSKDSHCKEEKSSSSSQSQNNSQSWSSEPGKVTGSSWKEDARSSTAGSLSAKGSSSGSRHRKSNNCMVGSVKGGSQKEAGGGKVNVLGKNTCEKTLQSGHASDKTTENGRGDNISSHKLIVKLPNPGRNPASSVNGGTTEDMVISASRGSSPIISDKHETSDVKLKVKLDACHANTALEVNTESWQSNEVKDGFTEGEDGDRLSTGIPSEDRSRIGEEIEKTSETSKTTLSSASGKEIISTKGVVDAEISRACEKVQTVVSGRSRPHVSKATCFGRDDGAMKLLANVAACEPSKDEQGSHGNSTIGEFMTVDGSLAESTIKCSLDGLNSQSFDDEDEKSTIVTKDIKDFTAARGQLDADKSDFSVKSSTIGMSVHQKDVSDLSKDLECPSSAVQDDSKHPSESIGMAPVCAGMLSEHKYVADGKEGGLSSNKGMDQCTEQIVGQEAKEISPDTPTEEGIRTGRASKNDDEQGAQLLMEMGNAEVSLDKDMAENTADGQMIALKEESDAVATGKDSTKASNCVLEFHEGTSEYACPVAEKVEQEVDADEKSTAYIDNQGVSFPCSLKNQTRDIELLDAKQVQDSGVDEDKNMDADTQHFSSIKSIASADDKQEIVTEKEENIEVEKTAGNAGGRELDQTNHVPAVVDRRVTEINARTDSGLDTHESRRETCDEELQIANHSTGLATNTTISSTLISQEEQQIEHSTIHSIHASELDAIEKIPTETVISAKGVCEVSNSSVKCDFDLNEGLAVDETNQDDAVICSTAASMVVPIYSAPETPMSNTNGLATTIPLPIKAKGPLMPPASPLRSKGDPGWKGSAATSAFRPAEPRKTQHAPHEGPSLNDAISSAGSTSGIQSRPHLDIDLNVPDEGVAEDGLATHLSARVKSSELATASGHDFLPSRKSSVIGGRLNLDLNRVEDCEESDPVATNTVVLDSSLKTLANGLSHKESQFPRGFDLNDGPTEDSGIEPAQWNYGTKSKGNPYLPPIPAWKMNGELHATSWLPPGNVHSGLAVTSLHSDRNERAYPVVAAGAAQHILSSTSGSPYCNDSYKGPVLGSTSAIAYPAATQPMFQYGGFSFASSLPFTANPFSGGPTSYAESSAAACFPTVPSQLVSAGPSSCVRPYVMNLADMSVTDGCRKVSRPILDLNAGPGTVDFDGREDRVASRQFSIADSQPSLEQQPRSLYQTTASGMTSSKRKEPEGGWDLH